jgi:hypothetical protein
MRPSPPPVYTFILSVGFSRDNPGRERPAEVSWIREGFLTDALATGIACPWDRESWDERLFSGLTRHSMKARIK